jgi:hypothetical protein
MSGLLDFALGFGSGAATGFVEQKKADLDAQRQANLARIAAKYKSQEQLKMAKEVAEMGLSDDPIKQGAAGVLGFKQGEQDVDTTATKTRKQRIES